MSVSPSPSPSQPRPELILITDALDEADDLEPRLEDLGWRTAVKARTQEAGLDACRSARPAPSLVVIDQQTGSLDVMTLIAEIERDPGAPSLLLARQLPPHRIREAAERGVGQILLHPCSRPALAAALWTVSARGRERLDARREAAAARQALEDRKRVEIAKGLLMRAQGLSEPDAYESLRRASQSRRQPMPNLAALVIESGGFLDPACHSVSDVRHGDPLPA